MEIIVVYVRGIRIPSLSVATIGKFMIRANDAIQFRADYLIGQTRGQMIIQVFDLIAITTFPLRTTMLILSQKIDFGQAENIVENITLSGKIHASIYSWSG